MRRLANRLRAVKENIQLDGLGNLGAETWENRLDSVHDVDDVGSRLALHPENDGLFVLEPTAYLIVLDAVDSVADFLNPHRRAVAVSHHQRLIRVGVRQLTIGNQSVSSIRRIQGAHGQVHVASLDCIHNIIDADLSHRHLVGIQLDPNCVFLRAQDIHLSDAADHGNALGQNRLREFIHGR